MLHGFASPVQKTDSFLQPAIFDPINIRLPAFKQIPENSGLVYLSRRTLYRGSLCEQVAGIRITPSTTRQRLSQHETSNNPKIQLSRCRKNIAISIPLRSN